MNGSEILKTDFGNFVMISFSKTDLRAKRQVIRVGLNSV
jgi:hypothetical protein